MGDLFWWEGVGVGALSEALTLSILSYNMTLGHCLNNEPFVTILAIENKIKNFYFASLHFPPFHSLPSIYFLSCSGVSKESSNKHLSGIWAWFRVERSQSEKKRWSTYALYSLCLCSISWVGKNVMNMHKAKCYLQVTCLTCVTAVNNCTICFFSSLLLLGTKEGGRQEE